ncbi:MAG: MgtC/SapB family protein [Labrys sp. (in: a-proteobacteria)]
MTPQDALFRLGLALAIGLLVGLERHWRERDAAPGQRTAGLRTYGLSGLLGGVAGLLATSFPPDAAIAGAVILCGCLAAYAAALIVFKRAEAEQDDTFSVTGVVAGLLVFALGATAVMGDPMVAAAAGVTATALLASREVLHGLLRRITWEELRSAIIILVMTFVALPLVPRVPIGPFGGIDVAEIWTLAIMMAVVAYVGYLAVRLFGMRRGLLLGGALGGLASSTAVTLTFARRSSTGEAPSGALAAGAACAGAVSVMRIGTLALVLSPTLLADLLPALIGAVAGWLAVALALSVRARPTGEPIKTPLSNPFDLPVILRFTLLIAIASFAVKAGVAMLGAESLVPLAAIAGLADADAVILSITRAPPSEVATRLVATAVAAAIAADITAKTLYAVVLGERRFKLLYVLAAATAVGTGAGAFFAAPLLLAKISAG